MRSRFFFITFLLLLAALVLSACSGLIPITGSDSGDVVATQNAEIVKAVVATATQSAMETQIAALRTQVAQVENQPTATVPAATATPEPTATATQVPPTATQVPPTATATPTALPCDSVSFVADMTIPDGSTITAGSYFVKTWRLRNTGACTWTGSYDAVFFSGDRMDASYVVDLPSDVYPGQVVDVSVGLVAPSSEGHYRGNWKMRDASGIIFGLGSSDSPFYVDINVSVPQSSNPYDFAASYCTAEWTTGAGRLPCPGDTGDSRGAIRRIDNPTLESGYVDNEPVLLTIPQSVTDGVIRGKFPAVHIESGHHFTAVIGCAYQADKCDVNFQLDYQVGNGSIQTLASWHEVYDKTFRSVNVDLSSLAGNDVKFILTVFANGSPTQDRAQWLAPKITKK